MTYGLVTDDHRVYHAGDRGSPSAQDPKHFRESTSIGSSQLAYQMARTISQSITTVQCWYWPMTITAKYGTGCSDWLILTSGCWTSYSVCEQNASYVILEKAYMPKCRPFAHANAIGDTELIPRTSRINSVQMADFTRRMTVKRGCYGDCDFGEMGSRAKLSQICWAPTSD